MAGGQYPCPPFPFFAKKKQKHPGYSPGCFDGVAGKALCYSFSEAGSDRFFGDFWFKYATIFCAEGGTATAPLEMIASASSFFPYSRSLSPLSGRTVEPSSETPANSPRARE